MPPRTSNRRPIPLSQGQNQQLNADGSAGDFSEQPLATRKLTIRSASDNSGVQSRGLEYYVSGDPNVRFFMDTQSGEPTFSMSARVADAVTTLLDAAISMSARYWDGSASQTMQMIMQLQASDTTPAYRLVWQMRAPSGGTLYDMLYLFDQGQGGHLKVREGGIFIKDGITAPGAESGHAAIYVDTADGDLKVKFGDNVIKTLATDT